MEMKECFFKFEEVLVGQTFGIQEQFKKILNDFDRIIEIGTHAGGLTLFLYRNKRSDCDLISYDIDFRFNQVSKHINIDFRIGDCFSEKTFNEIKKLILDKNKRVLLLCDGGNKNKEFNTFSEFLKYSDVIMCHDFAETIEEFNKIKESIGWVSPPELSLEAILASINKYGLLKYHYDDFKSVLWGSFMKGN